MHKLILITASTALILATSVFPIAASREVETKYLLFQHFTFAPTGPHAHAFPPTGELGKVVKDIKGRIGTVGSVRHKLAICVGPLALAQSDAEVQKLIRESFQVARDNDVAIAFHIDDQMFWEGNKVLDQHSREIVEWTSPAKTPSTGVRLDWGPTPMKAPPQLCLNSPIVLDVVIKRAFLIGEEIRRQLESLRKDNKEHLFAGVIAGWESRIGSDYDSGRSNGHRALKNKGFSDKLTATQRDSELSKVLKVFIETWASNLKLAGVPAAKIFCHIAFSPQGLADTRGKSYAEAFGYAVPGVAFSSSYRPGFSTYPMENTIDSVREEVRARGNPSWISAEGTNVVPNEMAGEPDMETYLGKMFNHGAVMVNIFSWGIGGEGQKNNFFRRATEGDEAISAYRKFLTDQALHELPRPANQFSVGRFRSKIATIQKLLPAWVQKTRRPDLAQPMMEKLDSYIKSNDIRSADTQADRVLKMINGSN